LIELSLLQPWTWIRTAERLRSGERPAAVLKAALERHYPGDAGAKAVDLRARARAALARAREAGIEPIAWTDASYPTALTTIVDPPPVLWVRGGVDALNAPAVAVVGARAASAYGLSVASQLAADLVRAGLVVVSGLARGVDSSAHRGALAGGGRTIAVLG